MNVATLTGRLTADPELRYTSSGDAVVNYTLAIRNPFKPDQADFVRCVTWKRMAEVIAEHVRKGDFISVSGRIQTSQYEAEDGSTRYSTEVNTDSVTLIGSTSHQEEKPEPKNTTQKGNGSNRNGNNRGRNPRS